MLSKKFKTGLVLILFLTCIQIYAQPVITLNGQDTVRINLHTNYISAGATAYDNVDGNLTDSIIFNTDLDTGSTGIYTEEYFVKNSKGQKQYKYRIIIVVLNIKPPSIKLIGPDTVYIEAKRNNPPFYDSGAIGIPGGSGPISVVLITGKVNTRRVGKYTLVYMVQDLPGNKAFAYRTIYVRDTRPPVWNDTTLIRYLQAKHPFTDLVKASDAYDDSIYFNVSYPATGPVNINKSGKYEYIYTARDSSGNTADTLKVSYIVRDTIPPVIKIIGNNPLKIQVYCTNKPYIDEGATATDEVDGDVSNGIATNGSVNTLKTGTYLLNYTVKDSSGNIGTAQRNVIVEDKMVPEIIFDQNPLKVLINTYDYRYTPRPKVWDDSCISPSLEPFIELVHTNVDKDVLGIYTEVWRVTDAARNISDEKTRTIEVVADLSTHAQNILSFNIYPNPVADILNINGEFTTNQPVRINLYSAEGRIVYHAILTAFADSYSISIENFAAGIYLLDIETNGKTYSKKIIKE